LDDFVGAIAEQDVVPGRHAHRAAQTGLDRVRLRIGVAVARRVADPQLPGVEHVGGPAIRVYHRGDLDHADRRRLVIGVQRADLPPDPLLYAGTDTLTTHSKTPRANDQA